MNATRLLSLACAFVSFSAFSSQDYPRVAAYVKLNSDGHQLNSDTMVSRLARFTTAVIPVSPAQEYYTNRLAELRAINPEISLLAYVPGDFMWNGDAYAQGY